MAKGQKFSDDFKMKIAQRAMKGEDRNALAEEVGVHYTTIHDWIGKFGKRKSRVKKRITVSPNGNNNGELERLRNQIANLTAERDFWKAAYDNTRNR